MTTDAARVEERWKGGGPPPTPEKWTTGPHPRLIIFLYLILGLTCGFAEIAVFERRLEKHDFYTPRVENLHLSTLSGGLT